jgi:rRNA-processing protein FCF1
MIIKVILDANFLIYCAEKKIDYASEIADLMNEGYELVVPSQVFHELSKLRDKADKYSDRVAANLALKVLEHNGVKVINSGERYADEAIIHLSRFNVVATLDEAIRKRVGRVIVVGKDKTLAFA